MQHERQQKCPHFHSRLHRIVIQIHIQVRLKKATWKKFSIRLEKNASRGGKTFDDLFATERVGVCGSLGTPGQKCVLSKDSCLASSF